MTDEQIKQLVADIQILPPDMGKELLKEQIRQVAEFNYNSGYRQGQRDETGRNAWDDLGRTLSGGV